MCDKAVDNYPHALKLVPDFYKTQKMCDKAVNTYRSTIQFVPECYKAQELCDKAVNRYLLFLILYPIGIKVKKYVTELFRMILLC